MSGAVGGLIRPVDLPAHPFGFHPHYLPSPRCLFCHSIPSHICGSAMGHSTAALFGPARCFGTLHHRIEVGAPSCCTPHVASPYLLARLPPRARIPAHFLLPPQHLFSFAPEQFNFPPGPLVFRCPSCLFCQRHTKHDCNNTLCWRTISKYSLYSCILSPAPPMASPRQPAARTT